ncbi:putative alkylated DNA repair protein alkB like 6 [Rosellinia necatrix]|uniref:Putative alkylated DNA repair protein alkB like 6 n=1 Tax=Rosellinia necatrix TaxID=77044 RepID=A0A1S8AAE5_ROSNE|nr:putative alkylated DNA repair protein alkB like 6 [Rosellinia necatrix]
MEAPSKPLMPQSLDPVRVLQLPQAAFYIPNFITEEEEQYILDKIASAPKPRWKQLSRRRLQTWPSALINNKLVDASLPSWLEEPIITRLRSLHVGEEADPQQHIFSKSPHKRPNHVLINEYPPGIGIMPHKDGSAYHPIVCTIYTQIIFTALATSRKTSISRNGQSRIGLYWDRVPHSTTAVMYVKHVLV